jgi:hypothetical protein
MTVVVGARSLVKADAGVVHALLQARYYDGSKGEFLSEDPVFVSGKQPQMYGASESNFADNCPRSDGASIFRNGGITKTTVVVQDYRQRHPSALIRCNTNLLDSIPKNQRNARSAFPRSGFGAWRALVYANIR